MTLKAKYRFEICETSPKAKTRQFWFRLVCIRNGEIMLTGERHPTKSKALRAMWRCIDVCADVFAYEAPDA